ncbi:hypothetical protein BDV93DRAFT_526422 [Ceratobasidium sp. AG-I]|nr:hypothetical protein BDV93DRAFT_526422 [Ceratobasidium sp. AG-I]
MSTPTSAAVPSSTYAPLPPPNYISGANRTLYTWSFLGAIALLSIFILFFVTRCYLRRRRFALRVQRALDSGHLDARVFREITSLPPGALYHPRSKKPKKVKPLMYEVRLGEARGVELDDPEESDVECEKVESCDSDWKRVMPFAVSKELSSGASTPHNTSVNPSTTLSSTPIPTHTPTAITPNNITPSPTTSHPPQTPSTNTTHVAPTPQLDNLLLSVLISMPSPPPLQTADLIDMEGVLPDICIGVTRVAVVG